MSVEWLTRTTAAQLLKCAIFVQKCHDGKKIPHTQISYSEHSLMTALIATEYTSDGDIHCAAMLKDVLTNPLISYNNIKTAFGVRVAEIVKELTDDSEKISQLGRKEYFLEKSKNFSSNALLIEIVSRVNMLNYVKHIREDDKWSIDFANETHEVFLRNVNLEISVKLIHQLTLKLEEKGYIT